MRVHKLFVAENNRDFLLQLAEAFESDAEQESQNGVLQQPENRFKSCSELVSYLDDEECQNG